MTKLPYKIFENAKISEIVDEAPNVKTFIVDLGDDLDFKPGQFAIVSLDDERVKGLLRSFSISTSPNLKNKIGFTIKKEGKFTSVIFEKGIGTPILVKAPFGFFHLKEEHHERNLVFIAGGTGLVPLMSMIRCVVDNKLDVKITLIYSCKTSKDFLYYNELNNYKNNKNFNFNFITTNDPSWTGLKGRISVDLIKKITNNNYNNSIYFLCGPTQMITDLSKGLQKKGIPSSQIKVERWN